MILYIAVTPDRLELPMYVADTAEEMAAWAGVKVHRILPEYASPESRC